MLSRIKGILKNKGYVLYTRPYELNIVGLRSRHTEAGRFDDEIHVFFKDNAGKWQYFIYKATTDPGTFWLENPQQPQGTAILAPGQYIDAYSIGLHQGKYKALVQHAPVDIIRDYDRNAYLDFFNGVRLSGMFGINIHRALAQGKTLVVDRYSAGCQVFENADAYTHFMELCQQHRSLYGNRFTYTLIDFRMVRRESLRRMVIGAFSLGLGLWGYYEYDHD